MRAHFVPRHYKRLLFEKLTGLRQGLKSIDEYHKEMETIMIHTDVRENEEQTMARFLAGMNYAVKHIVNHHPYNDMIELLHQAREAERQVIKDAQFAARSRTSASLGQPYNKSQLNKSTPSASNSAIHSSASKKPTSTPSPVR